MDKLLLYVLMDDLYSNVDWQEEQAKRILCRHADLIEQQFQDELKKWCGKMTPGLQSIRDAQAAIKKELDEQAELHFTSK